ncbi:MAG TPA: glycosyltransferase family 2 protein [Gemmatimonadales bacterium]|nr:glycosyltransferase family 2 protein [Gemmatimonadales bacterium]
MISVVVPFWSADPDTDAMLARCVASLDGQYDELILSCNEPQPDGTVLFSKYVNLGLRLARGDYRVVVNSDLLLQQGSLRDLCVPGTITSPVINGNDQPFWGSCFCVPADVLAKHGGLDEEFTGYYEDLDYCVRMWKAGVPLRSVPSVHCTHIGGATYARKKERINPQKIIADNEPRFLRKHGRLYEVRELV